MVEGQAALNFRKNPANGRIGIFEDLGCWNSQRMDAGGAQPDVASFIPLWTITSIVSFAFDLDRQPRVGAEEVEDISAGRVLPTEFQTVRLLA